MYITFVHCVHLTALRTVTECTRGAGGPDAAAEDGTAVDRRAEDGTAEPPEKGGLYGGIT